MEEYGRYKSCGCFIQYQNNQNAQDAYFFLILAGKLTL